MSAPLLRTLSACLLDLTHRRAGARTLGGLLVLSLASVATAAPGAKAPHPKAAGATARQAPLDIKADRMELDQPRGTVVFEGAVRAAQPGFVLRCVRLRARIGEDGALSSLVAEGPLEVTVGEYVARAGRATYDPETGVLELTGEPEVLRGVDRLRGERVRVWPDAGRVVVEQARGTVSAPALGRFEGLGRPEAPQPSAPQPPAPGPTGAAPVPSP